MRYWIKMVALTGCIGLIVLFLSCAGEKTIDFSEQGFIDDVQDVVEALPESSESDEPSTAELGNAADQPKVDAVLMTHGGIVGALKDISVKIFARTSTNAKVSIEYSVNSDLSESRITGKQATGSARDYTSHVGITGLSPDTRYYYSVLVNDVRQYSYPYPSFKTHFRQL